MVKLDVFLFLAGCCVLSGCSRSEYHGEYGVKASEISIGMQFETLKSKFGEPINLPFDNNIYYYVSSRNKIFWYGGTHNYPTEVVRVRFENANVIEVDSLPLVDVTPLKIWTKGPVLRKNIFAEIFGDIGKIKAPNLGT